MSSYGPRESSYHLSFSTSVGALTACFLPSLTATFWDHPGRHLRCQRSLLTSFIPESSACRSCHVVIGHLLREAFPQQEIPSVLTLLPVTSPCLSSAGHLGLPGTVLLICWKESRAAVCLAHPGIAKSPGHTVGAQ